MNKKIKIDKEKCIGCGTCVSLAPEVFELSNDLKAQVKKDANIKNIDLKMIKDSCPTEAIEIEK